MCKNPFYNTIQSQSTTRPAVNQVCTVKSNTPLTLSLHLDFKYTFSFSLLLKIQECNLLFIVGSYFGLKAFITIKSVKHNSIKNNSAKRHKILHKPIVQGRKEISQKGLGSMKSVWVLLFACSKDYLKTHILYHDMTA